MPADCFSRKNKSTEKKRNSTTHFQSLCVLYMNVILLFHEIKGNRGTDIKFIRDEKNTR